MSFDLRQLRHVLGLAEHGSFARAAVALHLSQPALSRSIQSLERQLGTTLFLRNSDGVVPTDLGRLFIERAGDLVRMAGDLEDELFGNNAPDSGRVAVGSGHYAAESVLVRAASRFVDGSPRASLRLEVGNWDDLLRRLRARDLDFFVAEFSTFRDVPDLEIEPMPEQPMYFVARAGHPLAARRTISATDTFSWPFVTMTRIPPRVFEPMLAAQRLASDPAAATRSFPSCVCNSLHTLKRIVEQSDAIAALTLSCVSVELASGTWTMLCTAPWLTIRYGLVSLKGRPLTRASEQFREMVREAGTTAADEAMHPSADLRFSPSR